MRYIFGVEIRVGIRGYRLWIRVEWRVYYFIFYVLSWPGKVYVSMVGGFTEV